MAISAIKLIEDLLSVHSKSTFSHFVNFKLIVHSVLHEHQFLLDDPEVEFNDINHVPTDFVSEAPKEHRYKLVLYPKLSTVFVYPEIDATFRISLTNKAGNGNIISFKMTDCPTSITEMEENTHDFKKVTLQVSILTSKVSVKIVEICKSFENPPFNTSAQFKYGPPLHMHSDSSNDDNMFEKDGKKVNLESNICSSAVVNDHLAPQFLNLNVEENCGIISPLPGLTVSCIDEGNNNRKGESSVELPEEQKSTIFDHGTKDIDNVSEKTELLLMNVLDILNKVMYNNSLDSVEKFKQLEIDSDASLRAIVDLIFEKPMYSDVSQCELYIKMCLARQDLKVDNTSKTLRTVLLNKCQDCFENLLTNSLGKKSQTEDMKESPLKKLQLKYKEKIVFHQQFTGICRLIGELFRERMLTLQIFLTCSRSLMNESEELWLECLLQLLSRIGKIVDKKSPRSLDPIFRNLARIVQMKSPKISPCIQALIGNIIDLRKNKWKGGYLPRIESKKK